MCPVSYGVLADPNLFRIRRKIKFFNLRVMPRAAAWSPPAIAWPLDLVPLDVPSLLDAIWPNVSSPRKE